MVFDNKLIKSLDALEGHRDGERHGYHREQTPVRLDNGVLSVNYPWALTTTILVHPPRLQPSDLRV